MHTQVSTKRQEDWSTRLEKAATPLVEKDATPLNQQHTNPSPPTNFAADHGSGPTAAGRSPVTEDSDESSRNNGDQQPCVANAKNKGKIEKKIEKKVLTKCL